MALLRYCGGKYYQTDVIVPHLKIKPGGVYCEPFVGGGHVAVALVEQEARFRSRLPARFQPEPIQIVLNDIDDGVTAFWSLIAESSEDEYEAFRAQCEEVVITKEYYDNLQDSNPSDRLGKAFRFFILNRTSRIETNGQRKLGRILERWTPDRLLWEMDDVRAALIGRTTVLNKDFPEVLRIAGEDWVLYCDPPYYEQGNTLYTEFQFTPEQHVQLRDMLRETPANWVLSYDMHPRIAELYDFADIHTREVQYSMKKRKGVEAIILPKKKNYK
jgi:DNA adenine methylase